MKVEREIARFSLPFAAGVMAAVYAGEIPGCCHQYFSAASISVASIYIILLMSRTGKKCATASTLALIVCTAFSCGFFTGMTGHMLAWSSTGSGAAGKHLHNAAVHMGNAIDALPFRSSGTNAIIKALLTGNRSGLTKDLQDAFRNSGASHILALSGLHLGIIYMAIRKTLAFAGNRPGISYLRSILTVIICGLYTAATGAGPSITRAFLFIMLGEAAKMTGRSRSTAGIMMAAITIQLTVSPMSAKQAGFQLSYAAMAGIAFIYPFLKNFWDNRKEDKRPRTSVIEKFPKYIWNSAAISISCQLTAGPVAYLYFGIFPLNFLLTNLIAVPLTGLIIPASLFTLALSCTGICPPVLLQALETAVEALCGSLAIIAEM